MDAFGSNLFVANLIGPRQTTCGSLNGMDSIDIMRGTNMIIGPICALFDAPLNAMANMLSFLGNDLYRDDGLRSFGQENNHIEIIFHPQSSWLGCNKKVSV